MITITADVLTRMAKSVSGEMRHTQKLDAFARVLGYPDQTALMGDLKKKAAAEQTDVSKVPEQEPMHWLAAVTYPQKHPVDVQIREIFKAHFDSVSGTSDDLYTISEWHGDVDRGDTSKGFHDWRDDLIEGFLDEVEAYDVLCAYARFEVSSGVVVMNGEGSQQFLHRAGPVLDSWYFGGGENVLGEEIMEIFQNFIDAARLVQRDPDDVRRADVEKFTDLVREKHLEICKGSPSPAM